MTIQVRTVRELFTGFSGMHNAAHFVLRIVVLDFIAASSCFAVQHWSGREFSSVGAVSSAVALTLWIAIMTILGAFAVDAKGIRHGMASYRTWVAATAVVVPFMFILDEKPLRQTIVLIAILTAVDQATRVILAPRVNTTVLVLHFEEEPVSLQRHPNTEVFPFKVDAEAIADSDELLRTVAEAVHRVQATVVEIPAGAGISATVIRNLSWQLRKQRVPIRMVLGGAIGPARVRTSGHNGQTFVEISTPEPSRRVRWGKRALDAVVSAALIAFLSPLFAVLTLLVAVTSPGPVIYRQERIGLDGAPFNMLKFRSMVVGADSQLAALLEAQGTAGKPLFKVDDDPRLTRIGAVMRKFSLDELPQLFNVLHGSMSLVGPRPQREAEVALYDADSAQRLGVLPGMTGMWQVSGRSRLSWEEAIEIDIYYAHNWSLLKDLTIMCKTFKAVVRGDGAQ